MKTPTAIVLVLTITSACARSQSNQQTTIQLDTLPLVDIGDTSLTSGGLIEFPQAATRLSNGNIAVNDLWGGHLLFFDSTARLIRTFGKKGSGPGEYNVLIWRGVCSPDSIYVTTDAMRDWVIDSAGNIRRDQTADISGRAYACNRVGMNIYIEAEPMTQLPRSTDPPLRAEILVGRDTTDRKSLGRFSVWEYGPTRPQMRVAMSDTEVFLGSGESGTVKVFSFSGTELREIETGAVRRPPTEAEYEAALNAMVAQLTDEPTRNQNKAMFRERFPRPRDAAAYSALASSPNGQLWVTTSLPGAQRTDLRVIGTDGGVSSVSLPIDLRIFEVGDDYVLGSYEDAEGFPHVVLYRYKSVRRD